MLEVCDRSYLSPSLSSMGHSDEKATKIDTQHMPKDEAVTRVRHCEGAITLQDDG